MVEYIVWDKQSEFMNKYDKESIDRISLIYMRGFHFRDTTVHRFYVGDSIEQRIKELMCNTGDIAKFLTTR